MSRARAAARECLREDRALDERRERLLAIPGATLRDERGRLINTPSLTSNSDGEGIPPRLRRLRRLRQLFFPKAQRFFPLVRGIL